MRKEIIKKCKYCNKEFSVLESYVKRGRGRFCSRYCSGKASNIGREGKLNANCAYCKKELHLSPKRIKKSKSSLFFCCRKHKDLSARIGSGIRIQPYFYKEGNSSYRNKAFKYYEHKCDECGYNEIIDILEVHHIDINNKNNRVENLVILCPNCHRKVHYLFKLKEIKYMKKVEEKKERVRVILGTEKIEFGRKAKRISKRKVCAGNCNECLSFLC